MHQMRLAETHAAINEQRVVRARGRLRDRAARRMRELVGWSDDKCVEAVARVEAWWYLTIWRDLFDVLDSGNWVLRSGL